MSVKTLARSLPTRVFQNISWREGTNDTQNGRFAALQVRHAGSNTGIHTKTEFEQSERSTSAGSCFHTASV